MATEKVSEGRGMVRVDCLHKNSQMVEKATSLYFVHLTFWGVSLDVAGVSMVVCSASLSMNFL